jgi:rhodanese-related sulfurtransferase
MNVLRSLAWVLVQYWIRLKFPHVKHISTAELAQRLEQSQFPRPLLLDARTLEEFEISHLPHAQRVAADLAQFKTTAIASDTPIVVYCSVGYRSARLAQQLQAIGYANVMNLEGSLFEWVNTGQPVYRTESLQREPFSIEQVTQNVHPYNSVWGLLLNGRANKIR